MAVPTSQTVRTLVADGFDYPVGKPDANGYYLSRGWLRFHPGEDWNANSGGNSDLGHAVYAIGNGFIVFARDVRRAWGNVVIIRHCYLENGKLHTIDSFYAHLQKVTVQEGQHVKRGDQVGTIGTNRGMYTAHLHFEIRQNIHIGVNRSAFAISLNNYHKPTKFIATRRNLPGRGQSGLIAINTFHHGKMQFYRPSTESREVSSRKAPVRISSSKQNPVNKSNTASVKRTFRVDRYVDY